jgi:hypothetical protein
MGKLAVGPPSVGLLRADEDAVAAISAARQWWGYTASFLRKGFVIKQSAHDVHVVRTRAGV